MNINQIARNRCEKLLKMAAEIYDEDKALSRRYVSLARKIAMRHRISLGSKAFCKKCNSVYVPGKTVKVRVASSKSGVIYNCLNCGTSISFPYLKEKQAKRAKTSL